LADLRYGRFTRWDAGSSVHGTALAAAIFPVLPMFVMWPAQWDQVYPLFLLAGLYFVLAYRVPLIDLLTLDKRLLLEGTRFPIYPSTNRTYGV
jgi:hypothetical protein